MASLAVLIVNYNTGRLAAKAVESALLSELGAETLAVHVVDNASDPEERAALAEAAEAGGWGDRVAIHYETLNHGFGRGNNLVLKALAAADAPPRHVLLLNPDAALKPGALATMAAFLDESPEVAVVGAAISKPSGERVSDAFRFPGLVSTFASAAAFGPISRALERWAVPLGPDCPEREVDWVAGAAAMLRLKAVEDVGFFDPAFFLYYEEVELMRRLKLSGRQIWRLPRAEAVHVEGAATDVKSGRIQRRRKPAYWYQSWRWYFLKSHGRSYALAAIISWLAGDLINRMVSLLPGRQPNAPLYLWRDLWSYAVRPLIGLGEGVND